MNVGIDKKESAKLINMLGDFCGCRDVAELTNEKLREAYGISQADVMVLFGGSILCGGDVLAKAMKQNAAKTYVIVGGVGHTTEALRVQMHREFPEFEAENLPEAGLFAAYLKLRYGLAADYLECKSTNCGNNITNLLDLLQAHGISFRSIILCQDATMQRRMYAGLRKYLSDDIIIINYASYQAKVIERAGELSFAEEILGMWDMEHYLTLLMGELPRLSDNKEGYGPNGKDFIAHVDIPVQVLSAFEAMKTDCGSLIRKANPLYAS